MGCPISKLDNEEAVQLCKDRKRFIKQAIESRTRFAAGHIAYIQCLRRVSLALVDYIDGENHQELFSNLYTRHPFTPIKKMGPEIVVLPLKSLCATAPIQSHAETSHIVNYLRSGGTPSISIEERPQSPEILRVESYSSMHQYGIDGFFTIQSPSRNSLFTSSPYNKPSHPTTPSPSTTQWDFFWNPFSSLDSYGYPSRESVDQTVINDGMTGPKQVHEDEGIPQLEDLEEEIETKGKPEEREERAKIDVNCETDAIEDKDGVEIKTGSETDHEAKGLQSHATESIEVSEAQNAVELELSSEEGAAADTEAKEETPGFTVYVDRRPTSMAEVVKDLETQFNLVCDSAKEVSTVLEASKAQFSSTPNELTGNGNNLSIASRMLNPVALFRSASSHSTSSGPFHATSSSRDNSYDSSSEVFEESLAFSGSHQSTLDRLYAWEKKLYEEVKRAEHTRIAYEKKCMQLKSQTVKGEDPSTLDKTRAMVRDLDTQMKVCMHSVESVSKRIETLRDEELQPQLIELIRGLARMWSVMAECHSYQKRTISEAKLLLTDSHLKLPETLSVVQPFRLARSAVLLESELRNWRNCFQSWITAQRSYVHGLAAWVVRCTKPDTGTTRISFSPRRSNRYPPIFSICVQWSRCLDTLHEAPVMDGLDLFAAGIGSACRTEGDIHKHNSFGASSDTLDLVERMEMGLTENVTAEEMAVRMLCGGMIAAVSSLTEFATGSAMAYEELVKKQCEKDTWANVKVEV